MRSKMRAFGVVAFIGLFAGASDVHAADIIVSNLSEPHTLWDTIQPFTTGGPPGFAAAQEFTTGGNDYKLAQILANLGNLDPGNNNEFKLSATLRADNNGIPGSVLTGFSYDIEVIPTSGFAHVEFDPTKLLTLTSGTDYWFVLSSSSPSGSVDWSFADTINSSGPAPSPCSTTAPMEESPGITRRSHQHPAADRT